MAVILLSPIFFVDCLTPAPTNSTLGMISTSSTIPADVVAGEWRMECTAESVENRGIVNRRYGEWGPLAFTMPRSSLMYSCTTQGEYSAVPLGASGETECVFVAHDDDGRWVDIAGVASTRGNAGVPQTA